MISPSQRLLPTKQTQETNSHALSGIKTRDHSSQASADRAATGTGYELFTFRDVHAVSQVGHSNTVHWLSVKVAHFSFRNGHMNGFLLCSLGIPRWPLQSGLPTKFFITFSSSIWWTSSLRRFPCSAVTSRFWLQRLVLRRPQSVGFGSQDCNAMCLQQHFDSAVSVCRLKDRTTTLPLIFVLPLNVLLPHTRMLLTLWIKHTSYLE